MRIADWLIERAQRTPYSHLQREDGSYYMRRFWLVPYNYIPSFGPTGCGWVSWRRPLARILQHMNIAIRVHHILAPDRDRHLHDHPWWWISVVLKGWYLEKIPEFQWPLDDLWGLGSEPGVIRMRGQGSYALRRPTDRHAITQIPEGGVWTLFITFKKVQTWGFYTEAGKVPHQVYESRHQVGFQ